MYANPVPLDTVRHADLRLREVTDLSYARGTNAIPINLVEFPLVSRDYPIGFIGDPVLYPVAIVGLQRENMFVDGRGRWKSDVYVPAYVRRYPFILGEADDQLALCIDDASPSIGKTGGQPLFAGGDPSPLVQRALDFCRTYHQAAIDTQPFVQALIDAGVLADRQTNAKLKAGDNLTLQGFKAVDLDKLRGVPGATLADWNQREWLLAIFAQVQSMLNWGALADLTAARKDSGVG
jgi:hypothetical protein